MSRNRKISKIDITINLGGQNGKENGNNGNGKTRSEKSRGSIYHQF